MAVGKWQWLNNPGFSKALVEMAGLKFKPEKEDRGIHLELEADWLGSSFRPSLRMKIRQGPLTLDTLPNSERFSNIIFGRLTKEFLGYHLPPCHVSLKVFVAKPDRKMYFVSVEANEIREELIEYPSKLVQSVLNGNTFDNVRRDLETNLKNINEVLRVLKGWGY